MSELIVHFGMHKTGSTSIQVSLYRHLDDPRFHYVNLGTANAGGRIATAFMGRPELYHANRKTGRTPQQLQDIRDETIDTLRAELRRAAGRTAILSGEDVCFLKEAELEALFDTVARCGYTGKAVGYVRPPKGYMESAFQQLVKGGTATFSVEHLYPGYRNRFSSIESLLGRGNVQYWRFDPARFVAGCVVQDFCHRLGITFRPGDVVRVNEALSRPAVSLLYAYRRYGPGYGVGPNVIGENNRLVGRLGDLGGAKLRLHSSIVGPVIDRNRSDMAWMEERLDAPLAENLTAGDDDAIRSEQDLLTFAPEALRWLARQIGIEHEVQSFGAVTPQDVAKWLHVLRRNLGGASRQRRQRPTDVGQQGQGELDLKEVVERVKRVAPEAAADLADAKVAMLLREAFRQVAAELESVDEGKVVVGGFGQFQVGRVEQEKQSGKAAIRRILFKPTLPR